MLKEVKGFYGRYQVNERGEVFNSHGSQLKLALKKNGYYYAVLFQHGVARFKSVHRLVAEAFIPNPENKPQVNHINGDKRDNRVENLEWVTHRENFAHASRVGLLHTSPVAMLDKEGNLIRTFNSLKSAEEYVGAKRPNGTAICNCIRGAQKTAYGYIWRYI
jgi:hypothetical protein